MVVRFDIGSPLAMQVPLVTLIRSITRENNSQEITLMLAFAIREMLGHFRVVIPAGWDSQSSDSGTGG